MKRGEIYIVDLDPVVGREQGGRRPVLVVSRDDINIKPLVVLVVPGTDAANVRARRASDVWTTPDETGLRLDTVFLCFQARALDHSRFSHRPVGRLSHDRMLEIEDALRYCLGV